MAHEYAVRLALIAFSTAAVQGLLARAAFEPALKLALCAAGAFYGLGWVCGEMARRIIEESVQLGTNHEAPLTPAPTPPSSGR